MLLIDRYLLRQFLMVYVICFCSLTGLFIVIDAFSNLEEFTSFAAKKGGLATVMAEYYGYRSLSFFDRTSSILTLIAGMFTLASFQRHNELTALLAAGIPKWRIIRSMIVAVAAISLLAAANREMVIPSIRDKLSLTAQDFEGQSAKKFDPRRDNHTDILLRGQESFASDQRIHQPSFRLPVELSDYGNELLAQDAFYQPADSQHPGGYLLRGLKQPSDLQDRPSLALHDEPIVITPLDAPWLAADECFVVSDVTFLQLVSGSVWRQYSSTAELIAGLRNPSLDFGADERVAIHSRLVRPVLDLTLLFLGLPLIVARERGNMFMAIGLAIGVVVAFMLVVFAFQYLGTSYLISPTLAAWAPVMILTPTAVCMSEPLRR